MTIRAAIIAFCSAGFVASAAAASTMTLTYNGQTSGATGTTAHISGSPVKIGGVYDAPINVVAGGFDMTDTTGGMGDFVAWCLDLEHWLRSATTYEATSTPYSNATPLSGGDVARLQSVFDANYGMVDVTDIAQSTAFQLVLWETIYDGTDFDLAGGAFMANGIYSGLQGDIDTLAARYLSNAAAYNGPHVWDLTFLESTGRRQSQGLITATMATMPLPAGAVLLLTGLGALTVMRRRKLQA